MASKIQSHTFYVAVTPYKEESVEDTYNELSVMADYNQYTHNFYVSLHPGWKSEFGHGCVIMGDDNPLTASTRVIVKPSPKNSQKFINEMGAALELAKRDIAWLFDQRMWTELKQFVKDVALSGYNAMLEGRINGYKSERKATAQVEVKPVTENKGEPEAYEKTKRRKAWNVLKKKYGAILLLQQTEDEVWTLYEDAAVVAAIVGQEVERFGSHQTPRFRFAKDDMGKCMPMIIRAGYMVKVVPGIGKDGETVTSEQKGSNTDPALDPTPVGVGRQTEVKQVNVMSLMGALQTKGVAKLSDFSTPIESTTNKKSEDKVMMPKNNESVNVQDIAQVTNRATEDVDVAEVNDIMPQVTKRKVAEGMVQAANNGKATTLPLGSHGTVVICGCGGQKTRTENTERTEKVQDSVPQGGLTYQTYDKLKTNKTTKKEYTVTHAKIIGFAATDEAYQRGVELHGAVSGEMVDGVKVLGLYFSHRYAAAAKLVCDALNAGRSFEECKAIIDTATEENAKKREEWKAKAAEWKQKREERKAAREAAKAKPAANATVTGAKSYTLDEVAAMLGKLLPQGTASTEDIKKLLAA